MSSSRNAVDLWSELIESNQQSHLQQNQQHELAVVYQRRKPINPISSQDVPIQRRESNTSTGNSSRVSFVIQKRDSRNRSLSIRGRTSIAVAACAEYQSQRLKGRRKQKPPRPRGKAVQPPNFDKERAYFQEVDAFELMEESPSPKRCTTWIMGTQTDHGVQLHLSSVLRKWLIARKINHGSGLNLSLSKILETPGRTKEIKHGLCFEDSSLKTVDEYVRFQSGSLSEDSRRQLSDGVHRLSLNSCPTLDEQSLDPYLALLTACGQSAPSKLAEVLLNYCNPETIVKVGEGTFGEAFKIGEAVCKIVPFDGDQLVNGEVQKRSEEVFEEVILSRTLSHLRGCDGHLLNACSAFIQTIDLRVCHGPYDSALIRAWEEWDGVHGSENDNPKDFSEKQNFVLFIQEHGGKDLESFVLLNFDEARSLLVQVTFALAVAEGAYEFEHRDLHWGNILLSRKGSGTLQFILEGRKIHVNTYGLLISIIDFTLSRINTGEDILFLDLSSDPELFEGPKGDKQSDTYRMMKEVTGECWEGSFLKTNVLWLQYLVDILLLKKSYDRMSKDERELRSLKKRLNSYASAREATEDPFFSSLIVNDNN
ncbi:non-receptor serine/threonine protein kinase [Lithospermum erythrorhizon]|uniref:non-specific serine/threonine protein kinase n=1 Tax=Lithospermum erythrorhizon TaxID=34254 RepID=A0AAV3NG13_LITER